MTLFDPNLKLQRYSTELDILKEFCYQRLKAYENRKSYLISKLEKEKRIISNKTKFILAIVNNELIVNKKKKKVLVEELYRKGYDPYKDINKIKKEEIFEQELLDAADNPEDNEEIIAGITVKDYDYLLSMPIFSLTLEKVEDLLTQLKEKERELEILRNITVETMWLKDIEKVEEAIEFQRNVELSNREESNKFKVARKQGPSSMKKKKKKKKLSSDEESEGGDISDSSEFLVNTLNIKKNTNKKTTTSSNNVNNSKKRLRKADDLNSNELDNTLSVSKTFDDNNNLTDNTPLINRLNDENNEFSSNNVDNKSTNKNSRKKKPKIADSTNDNNSELNSSIQINDNVNDDINITISPNKTINVNEFSSIKNKLLELGI